MSDVIPKEQAIRSLVKAAVAAFASGFEGRHLGEINNPNGTINMKVHNVFIAALGPDIQYYTALVRSLDSSLGNMLEQLAISIAELSFEVRREVSGSLSARQTAEIARLLEEYKRRVRRPHVADYADLIGLGAKDGIKSARHDSDYYLHDHESGARYLIELKIGGDLDNKKARSEKEALLEQYAILGNALGKGENVYVRFATAYNRFGEGAPWRQERVRQYFADEELLIGCDFWNFIAKDPNGYRIVLNEYKASAPAIINALKNVQEAYLG